MGTIVNLETTGTWAGWLTAYRTNKQKRTRVMVVKTPFTAGDQMTLLRALAQNMDLASSNDVPDTLHWLSEHVALVGIALAVEWYAKCASARLHNVPIGDVLDWKEGIAQARL